MYHLLARRAKSRLRVVHLRIILPHMEEDSILLHLSPHSPPSQIVYLRAIQRTSGVEDLCSAIPYR